MNYEKPEVAVLGDGARLIKGNEKEPGDSPSGASTDCELDD
jgi:hypothetical protein